MKELETTKFIVKTRESIIDFLNTTFQNTNENNIISDANIFFENLILNDLNSIQQNIIEMNEEEKAQKYINLQISLLSINRWKIIKASEKVYPKELDFDTQMIINSHFIELEEPYLNIKKEYNKSIEMYLLFEILNQKLYELIYILMELINEQYPNSKHKFDIPKENNRDLIKEINSKKIKLQMLYSAPYFAALIDCNKLKIGENIVSEYNKAANLLCKSIDFIMDNSDNPLKESVVSKYLSYKTEKNQTKEFCYWYNMYVEMLGFPDKKLTQIP